MCDDLPTLGITCVGVASPLAIPNLPGPVTPTPHELVPGPDVAIMPDGDCFLFMCVCTAVLGPSCSAAPTQMGAAHPLAIADLSALFGPAGVGLGHEHNMSFKDGPDFKSL